MINVSNIDDIKVDYGAEGTTLTALATVENESATLSYQWQQYTGDDVPTILSTYWTNVGNDSNQYDVDRFIKGGTYYYRCIITAINSRGQAFDTISNIAAVTVDPTSSTFKDGIVTNSKMLDFGEMFEISATIIPTGLPSVPEQAPAESELMILSIDGKEVERKAAPQNKEVNFVYDTSKLTLGIHTATIKYTGSTNLNQHEETIKFNVVSPTKLIELGYNAAVLKEPMKQIKDNVRQYIVTMQQDKAKFIMPIPAGFEKYDDYVIKINGNEVPFTFVPGIGLYFDATQKKMVITLAYERVQTYQPGSGYGLGVDNSYNDFFENVRNLIKNGTGHLTVDVGDYQEIPRWIMDAFNENGKCSLTIRFKNGEFTINKGKGFTPTTEMLTLSDLMNKYGAKGAVKTTAEKEKEKVNTPSPIPNQTPTTTQSPVAPTTTNTPAPQDNTKETKTSNNLLVLYVALGSIPLGLIIWLILKRRYQE